MSDSKNYEKLTLQDTLKMRSAIKQLLFLAVTLESTDLLYKTREADKQELSNYVVNKLGE